MTSHPHSQPDMRGAIARAMKEHLVASTDADGMPIISGFNSATDAILALPHAGSGVQNASDPEASIPTYGNIPWDQLGRDVVQAQTDRRDDYPFDPAYYPGHQMVGINFNSLARIVDKYRLAALSPDTARDDRCKNCTPENCAYIKGGYGRCTSADTARGREKYSDLISELLSWHGEDAAAARLMKRAAYALDGRLPEERGEPTIREIVNELREVAAQQPAGEMALALSSADRGRE